MKIATKIVSLILLVILTLSLFVLATPFGVQANSNTHTHLSNTDSLAVEGDPNFYNVTNYESGGVHKGITFSGMYFGVTSDTKLPFTVQIYKSDLRQDDLLADLLGKKIHAEVDYLDSIANTQYSTSDVYKFNNAKSGETIDIEEQTAAMIQTAKEMYELTGGAYNPAVYRLVDLWGFSSRTYYVNGNLPYDREWVKTGEYSYGYPPPDEKYIEAFMKLCNFNTVELNYDDTRKVWTLTKNCPSVTVDGVTYEQWIDLGGIAKGFAVDKVKEILADNGIEHYFINAAQSSMAMTTTEDGKSFGLAITNPDSMFGGYYSAISVQNCNLSTSGLYVRYYNYGGKTYSHIIDGKTGYPVETKISTITIVSDSSVGDSSAQNDCLTTALTVLGKDNLVQFMNKQYTWDNKLKIVSVYDNPSSWDKKKPIITNLKQEEFLEINEDFYIATKITEVTDPQLLEQGIEYLVSMDESNNATKITIIVIVAVVAALLVAFIVYRLIKASRQGKAVNILAVKKDKPFKLGDIALYGTVVVLIVVLFSVFVFGAENNQITTVRIESMATGETLFAYDVNTDVYSTATSETFDIKVERQQNAIVVTITQTIGNKQRSNTATISLGDNISVKMTDSVCGMHQECVRNFPAITSAGGAIVCSPNNIKVTTSDVADYILI